MTQIDLVANSIQETEQVASEIRQKIALLADFDGESLKDEMFQLKQALMKNPAACSLLQNEDIGMAVAALRRMVGVAVASANAPKAKKASAPKASKKLTPAELAAAMKEISDDDFN